MGNDIVVMDERELLRVLGETEYLRYIEWAEALEDSRFETEVSECPESLQ